MFTGMAFRISTAALTGMALRTSTGNAFRTGMGLGFGVGFGLGVGAGVGEGDSTGNGRASIGVMTEGEAISPGETFSRVASSRFASLPFT